MKKIQLIAEVTKAIEAIEFLERACLSPTMKSWDKTAIHVEELSRIKNELQTKYESLIAQLPDEKPAAGAELSKADRAVLNAYNRYEAQIKKYTDFIARKTDYHSNIGKTGFLVPELTKEIETPFEYPEKYKKEDGAFATAVTKFEQHKSGFNNLKQMLSKTQDPTVIRGLLEDFIKTYRTLRLAVEKERNRIQAEGAQKEALWNELNEVSTPLVKEHGINLQADQPYKALGEKAASLYAQVGNTEHNRALKEIIEQLKGKLEQLNQERKANLVELNKKIEGQLEGFNHFYDNIAKQLTKAGVDHGIIAPIKERFLAEYPRVDSETDEVQFKTEKLAALTQLNEELKTTILSEKEYICSQLVDAIDKIADKFARHFEALENQLADRGIKFEETGQALIDKAKRDFAITVQYQGVLNPDILESILDDLQKKKQEFGVVWPTVVATVKHGQQARITELKDKLIPQQKDRFGHFYAEIQKKLTGYNLWEQYKGRFVEIQEDFNREYEALSEEPSPAAIIDFYQAKQNALNEYIEDLTAEILTMQEAICAAMISAIDVRADRVDQAKRDINAQIQEDFEFTKDESALIEKMNACTVQHVPEAAEGSKSPQMLEPILTQASETEKELKEVLPPIRKAIERCRQVKIDKLKEAISQQQKAFGSTFDTVHANLDRYELDQSTISEIKDEFEEEYDDALNEDEIAFYQEKLSALQAITRKLDSEAAQAKALIAAKLIQAIDVVAVEIDTKHLEIASKTDGQGYELLEREAAFVTELKTPLARDYRQSVDQAKLEEHLKTLLATKDGLAAESEKIDKIVARHDLASKQKGNTQSFLTMNGLGKDEAAALLTTLGQYLNQKELSTAIHNNLPFITQTPALEVIEDWVRNDGNDTLGLKDKIAFVKLLLEQKIPAKAEFFDDGNNKMAVVNLLNEKGLKRFITPELIGNESLCRALLLIEQHHSEVINEELMSDKSININKMAVVITKLDDFVKNYQGTGTAAEKQQLQNYFTVAMPELLAKDNCDAKKEKLSTLAKTHFEHEHFPRRLLADLLQCITGAFLIIMPVRYFVYGTHPLFTKAETSPENQVKQEILPELDRKDDDSHDENLPPVEIKQ